MTGVMRSCASVILALGLIGASSARAEEPSRLEKIFENLSESPAKDTLFQIPDLDRRLLALRSYARSRTPLVKRWSWTEKQIKAYRGSAEQEALLAEVGEVIAHFAAANPGYELYAGTRVRSLDVQIKNWNKNNSVGVAAAEIFTAWKEKFEPEGKAPAEWKPKEFWSWLRGFKITRRAYLAAPGMSRHGRARAVDFQIMKDGKIFAGTRITDIKKVWQQEGWGEKLNASIKAAGPSFVGPLQTPFEPWHYDYDPEVKADVAAN
ncbi:MAG: hypothetical protein AAGF81_00080 [Pseudomonadota bacterium]